MKINVADCWEKASFARLRNLELPGSGSGNLADISTHGKSFRGSSSRRISMRNQIKMAILNAHF